MPENEWQCRWSPTLGELEARHEQVWGTRDFMDNEIDRHRPCVFFGVYGLPDFYTLWRYEGRKCILWAGSDIQHFLKGYWLDKEGKMKLRAFDLAPWIDTYCESYVENEVEQNALASVGIRSKVVPSFLGDVKKFEVSFKSGNKVYTSVSGDDFKLYGWDKIHKLAWDNPQIEFHLYGNTLPFPVGSSNVKVHGRVPKEQMNEEIKDMQGALRLTEFDGFSEILAKSVLMGQWPISLIEYPHISKLSQIADITKIRHPNLAGREYYLKKLNKYPWNQ